MEIRESKIRESLIKDIEFFLSEAIKIYNEEKTVKRLEYLNLEMRINDLNNYNFESEEKYNSFLKFINKSDIKDRRNQLTNYFQNNPLKEGYFKINDPFLEVDDYLRRLISWLK